ncbi:MAG: penicillin-binding transpeptidase domain-containing protein [Prevotella sp.]|nr:penicillin-binding transpeptidase domain-containing protein [Prevotella sp.]
MSKFDSKNVMPRYFAIAVVFTILGCAVIGKALYIMSAKKSYWMEVAARQKRDSVCVMPNRGNILSCDGQLMASSIPEYKIYMDFQAGGAKKDTMWMDSVDLICEGLHRIFPTKSVEQFKEDLEKGHKKMSRNWAIWNKRIDYNTFVEVKKLPIFRQSQYKGGFYYTEFNARRRPFGSLAQRTVGDLFGAKDSARCGLELSYDSILRGTTGLTHRRKVLNKYMNILIAPPVDGADIVTTIDVYMQDLAEKAVVDELKEINGELGVAVLMEVKTGDIKAIVNMTRCADGQYREVKNNAVSDLREPGSVFKTASILVALDDGVVDTTYRVDTGSGVWPMHGREMKDHNWRRGGYQVISLPRSLEVSSNIGVSRIIDEHYGNHPEKFVEGIYRTGLASDLHLPFVGSTKPRIRMPEKNSRGQYLNWSKTALAWMSIGYETQIPPISTVTFYNAIANDGIMMRPRFVKEIQKNGETIAEFPPEKVMERRIAKLSTVKTMQTILEHVVSQGLGKKAGSKLFKVAGKTGTAQIAEDGAGYHSGTMKYWLSFAGFFPADNPRYSCIVCLKKSGLPASGGGMSGVVFHEIAEGVMARLLKFDVADAQDTTSILVPDVKNGNILAADYVLSQLGVKTNQNWTGSYATGNPIWGTTDRRPQQVALTTMAVNNHTVPDVRGMGARDAVYLLEQSGLKVQIKGCGKVVKQSAVPGTVPHKGSLCEIILEN